MNRADDLAVLAHELRAPVSALRALADAAGAAPAPKRRRILGLAIAAGRDIERILADPELRTYERAQVAIDALVEAVVLLDPARITPRVEPGIVVDGDATRLRQALVNLAANGLRHGRAVRLTATSDDRRVFLEVSDDGPGVPEGIDIFARGASDAGSTGLGLWLARTIAEAHGGTLELVPTRVGATFRLVLPSSGAGL